MNFLATIIAITLGYFPDILWTSEKCTKECSGKVWLITTHRNWFHTKIPILLHMRN
jgi:hypothetical protein